LQVGALAASFASHITLANMAIFAGPPGKVASLTSSQSV